MRWLSIALLISVLPGCSPPSDPVGIQRLSNDGKPVLINYWAIWCKPCREEIPELNEFAREYADRASVYAVNFDGVSGEKLLTQTHELGIEFALLEEDPAYQLGYARPMVLPTTVILNGEGVLLERLLGPQTGTSLAQALNQINGSSSQ